ncbi:MAG: hypothetical protein COA79_01315 [Planctomycetota bacterium]|nr:MAG: hypothetical protein COA79_01315 [Planctomycetota bacterium]
MKKLTFILLMIITVFYGTLKAENLGLQISQTSKKGVYSVGAKITWKIKRGKLDLALAKKIRYTVKLSGKKILKEGLADLIKEELSISVLSQKPGALLLTIHAGKKHQCSGALISPKKIIPSEPKPADFDEFWKKKLAEQNKVPMNIKLKVETVGKDFKSWLITMDTIRGKKIHGRLARPRKGNKFPAILHVQWAGVYGLHPNWATRDAKAGWLTLNVIAHDLPINKSKDFYTKLKKGKFQKYVSIGNTDREKSYFLRMCLACSRAVDYLSTRPDWDGKVLVVAGASQGGYQSIVAAGLNKKVTAIIARVPAGCDTSGPVAGRAPSWPYWWRKTESDKKIKDTARYFDAINFAYNVKCPALIGFGLGDETSRAEGVMAAINSMQGKVKLAIEPNGEHKGSSRSFSNFSKKWKKTLLAGQELYPSKK